MNTLFQSILFLISMAMLGACAHETVGPTPASSSNQSAMSSTRYPYQRLGSADPQGPREPR